ncbi:MAG: TrkA family potassium uptake protein [Campylobacterales bacterium]|nr:TrkA family potassium uptake protein [Campylobacterales bacterium]
MKIENIIVFGYSLFGKEIAKQLKYKMYKFIILCHDETNIKNALKDGYEAYHEDITDDKILIKYGILKDITTIFCVTDDDLINMFVTISARALNKELKIVSKAHTLDSKQKFLNAGANKILDPYELSANRIFDFIKKPLIVETIDNTIFGTEDIKLAEILIKEESVLNGKNLLDIDFAQEYNLILVGVLDKELGNDFLFSTSGYNHKLDVGDILVVVGYMKDIEKLKKG